MTKQKPKKKNNLYQDPRTTWLLRLKYVIRIYEPAIISTFKESGYDHAPGPVSPPVAPEALILASASD
jgi:hypothetical protein